MAKTIAYVYGTALEEGASKNRRLYTAAHIAGAVKQAQPRVAAGEFLSRDLDETDREAHPLTSLTHHDAGDDSEKIVGRIDDLSVDGQGRMRYKLAIPNTSAGRTMLELADTADGPPFIRGMSIRGSWVGKVRQVRAPDGEMAETADGLEIEGLDFTRRPGVLGALIDKVERVGAAPKESATERTMIYESAPEARVEFVETDTAVEEKGSTAAQRDANVGGPYADPGYQSDKKRRYQLDTKAHSLAAWSFINQAKNAKAYTAPQLKRVKARIMAALKKFGVQVDTKEHWLIEPARAITETDVAEMYGMDSDTPLMGGFSVSLCNGPVNISVSSYQIDPADLDLIGRAAMDGACKALAALDPDMDGDIDVPGADTEDTDHDMESAPPSPVTEQSDHARDTRTGDESSTPDSTDPATIPAADETKEPDVSEPITQAETPATAPAVPPAAAHAPAAITEPTLTLGQVKDLFASFAQAVTPAAAPPQLVGAGAPAEAAPAAAAPVAEAAPTSPAVPAPPAAAPPVTETTDQRDQRIAEAAVRMFVQQQAEAGNVGRKGFVVDTSKGVREAADGTILPDGVPDKPFHELTPAEWKRVRNQVGAEAAGVQLPQE